MNRTVSEIINYYKSLNKVMMPTQNSVSISREVWKNWESKGIEPPDIHEISQNNYRFELGFFHELVEIVENHEAKKYNIWYCAYCLNTYNFYAISGSDGYVVLVDDYFFQMLFFLCLIFSYDVADLIYDHERDEIKIMVNHIVKNNYIYKRKFDFEKQNKLKELLERDYEISEFANYFFNSLKIFILSHEIGHHILGHTRGFSTEKFMSQGRQIELEVDKRSILDEYEADNYGYKIFEKISKTSDAKYYYTFCKYRFDYAPLFMFDLFEKLDSFYEKFTQKPISYRSHPQPRSRFLKIKEDYNLDINIPMYQDFKKSLEMIEC